ncbi:MaoC family dehydratase [Alistipes sp. kh20]|jgi:acyl dehydratase|uniref:MaoC family dehydratase n=1 Tax=Alistipes TaxID=239759 RepID=UPI00189BCD60|nr:MULTISPECIES: MaoC family dehydratase [Alistipes]MBS4765293.1 MaoC family dehydratase [Alistipes montrealensis]
MSQLIINNFDEFAQYTGQELGVSDYLKITQEQINLFADATLDHQWIHVDTERAKTESPYKSTIAHGYLNLSVLPYLWAQVLKVNNVKMLVNYGIEKLRFNQPVLVGSEVRLRASLLSLTNLRGIAKAEIKVSLEIKDCPKTALDATVVFLYHFQ